MHFNVQWPHIPYRPMLLCREPFASAPAMAITKKLCQGITPLARVYVQYLDSIAGKTTVLGSWVYMASWASSSSYNFELFGIVLILPRHSSPHNRPGRFLTDNEILTSATCTINAAAIRSSPRGSVSVCLEIWFSVRPFDCPFWLMRLLRVHALELVRPRPVNSTRTVIPVCAMICLTPSS
jgi:hypothetical protein